MKNTIDELLAEAAIRDVQMRYCRAVDRMDFDLLRTCFAGRAQSLSMCRNAKSRRVTAHYICRCGCNFGRQFDIHSGEWDKESLVHGIVSVPTASIMRAYSIPQ